MRFLLDTHLLLWWLAGSPALSAARELISSPDHMVFISAVNHWEIAIKVSLGKLVLPADFHQRLGGEGFENLDFRAAHARHVAAWSGITGTRSTGH